MARELVRRIERIPDFDALLAWSARADLISAAELGRVSAAARGQYRRGVRALTDTRWLRERLHETLTSTGSRRQQAIQLLWPRLTPALRHAQPEGLPLQLAIEVHKPDDLTRRLALLALQFLTSDDVRLVKVCADDDCGWVFLDRSRVRRYNARRTQGS